jgi:hypothetical protein
MIKLLALTAALALSGCVSVKEARIDSATFNTAGWKSQAGIGESANIDATTVPSANLNQ